MLKEERSVTSAMIAENQTIIIEQKKRDPHYCEDSVIQINRRHSDRPWSRVEGTPSWEFTPPSTYLSSATVGSRHETAEQGPTTPSNIFHVSVRAAGDHQLSRRMYLLYDTNHRLI